MRIFEVPALWLHKLANWYAGSRVVTWATKRRNRRHLAQTRKLAESFLARISALKKLNEELVADNAPRQIVLARMAALDHAIAKWNKRPNCSIGDASRLITAMKALRHIVNTGYAPKLTWRIHALNAMCDGSWRGYTPQTRPTMTDSPAIRII